VSRIAPHFFSLFPLVPIAAGASRPARQEGGAGDGGAIEVGGQDFDLWSYTFEMLIALAVVVALIVLIAWLLRRFSGQRLSLGSGALLRVVASVPLGDRRLVAVLRVGGRYYLLGIAPAEISLLAELEADEVERNLRGGEVAAEGGFARLLRRLLRGKPEEGGEG